MVCTSAMVHTTAPDSTRALAAAVPLGRGEESNPQVRLALPPSSTTWKHLAGGTEEAVLHEDEGSRQAERRSLRRPEDRRGELLPFCDVTTSSSYYGFTMLNFVRSL